ncbi:hypothetical protein H9I45_14590 [Polaribacter haliotis]|uniref:Tail specific protease domain-containing protein n=1 Tax=Polaribacter haliotis TaxID=1888915 RepID=A0A7L8AEZ4_9FLAO|nr:S41 family peptidase [Polaribacter haliotis]QOD60552.1 hypothetical protein H9I45_14590 [Polaribacter haliotis]
MKKIILLIVILFINKTGYSNTEFTKTERTKNLIYIWGLLKYKHPNVSRGNFNINEEFINEFKKIEALKSKKEFNEELLSWIQKFDSKKYKYKVDANFLQTNNLFTKNADFSWIDKTTFSPELISTLNKIKDNSNYGDYYASVNKMSSQIEFNNDNSLEGFDVTKKTHRLLFLASFWNKMRYWNVNIYLTETPWNSVLTQLIPYFLKESKTSFYLAKDKLIAKLNDSHSNYNASSLFHNKNRKFSLYGGRIVNDTLVVKTIFNKSLAEKENIELGDLIYAINGKKLKNYYIEKFSSRISASNENYLKSIISKTFYLLSNDSDSLQISVLKKNKTKLNTHINLYKFNNFKYEVARLDTIKKKKWNKISDKIGYINLKEINKKELRKAFKELKNTKGIIIDLRNYPRNLKVSTVPDFLYRKKKIFMKILTPLVPSYGNYDTQTKLKILNNPFSAGKSNINYYKGKIVLLVDRSTGSMAEYFGMAIQQAPNCITVGEQTFGAVMNRNTIILKDSTKVDFTGNGAFYPNNKNVQREGLKIDYVVKESAKNYNSNKYIEEAIKLIKQD